MFYRQYRITLADFSAGDPVFLVTKRWDANILTTASSVSSAIDKIRIIEAERLNVVDSRVPHAAATPR